MKKFELTYLVPSKVLYCAMYFYAFWCCCYSSIKPVYDFFHKNLPSFSKEFLERYGGMPKYYFTLLILAVVALVMLVRHYKEEKLMKASLLVSIPIIAIVTYAFRITPKTILQTELKYIYWLLCLCLILNLGYAIWQFISEKH